MEFYASGKLMLFGEYLALRGAACLAIPLSFGQTMRMTIRADDQVHWVSKSNDTIWFSAKFTNDLKTIETSDGAKAKRLLGLLAFLKSQKKTLFSTGLDIETRTNFSPHWGFGTSSTLVSLLAQWSGVDPYLILENSFGGSGYDIACATADTPILYDSGSQRATPVHLAKAVTSKILFVYSGKKQNTKPEVTRFMARKTPAASIECMNKIVAKAWNATAIEDFEKTIQESEDLLSTLLNRVPLKEDQFRDYPYFIKSLGAWGGDFFMASCHDMSEAQRYFYNQGYTVQFTYDELIKK